MGDDDDGLSLRAHAAQDAKKLFHFLRRQHSRRLIQNQNVSLPVQSLQQFNALLLADRQVLHCRTWIDGQMKLSRERTDFFFCSAQIERGDRAGFGPKHDVFSNGHWFDQHEMLMHHANAESDGVVRRVQSLHFAVYQDFASICSVETVRDAHGCGFACAILAHDGVNRSSPNLDAHAVICQHVAEALRNVSQLEHLAAISPSRW